MKKIFTTYRFTLLVIAVFAVSFVGTRALYGQGIRNLQNSQELFNFIQQHRLESVLTGSGDSQYGGTVSIDKIRLAPKSQKNAVDNDSLQNSGSHGLLHVIGSTIIDRVATYYNARFSRGVYVGLNEGSRVNGSQAILQIDGALTIKELADGSRVDPAPVCTGSDGVIQLCNPTPPPVTPPPTTPPADNGPLSWNGNPYRQCENGRVIAYIGVTGAEGQPVEFRRGSNGPWMNANNGNNGFTYEIPKYDNPNDTMPDTYCKEFRYRVPNLPNKSTNDVNNGVWGCVNTMTRTECPD